MMERSYTPKGFDDLLDALDQHTGHHEGGNPFHDHELGYGHMVSDGNIQTPAVGHHIKSSLPLI